jgi:hypothetical protein
VPRTPDRRPGALEEDEEIRLGANAVPPTVPGAVSFDGSAFQFRDAAGIFDPRSSAGVSEAAHKALLQLIHFIDEGPAEGFASGATRTTTGTVFPSQVLWRRADNTKLVEQNVTWTGAKATTVEWKVYAADGTTVLATVTDTITYSGAFETSRTRAIA